jgi:hypothetical protein
VTLDVLFPTSDRRGLMRRARPAVLHPSPVSICRGFSRSHAADRFRTDPSLFPGRRGAHNLHSLCDTRPRNRPKSDQFGSRAHDYSSRTGFTHDKL